MNGESSSQCSTKLRTNNNSNRFSSTQSKQTNEPTTYIVVRDNEPCPKFGVAGLSPVFCSLPSNGLLGNTLAPGANVLLLARAVAFFAATTSLASELEFTLGLNRLEGLVALRDEGVPGGFIKL